MAHISAKKFGQNKLYNNKLDINIVLKILSSEWKLLLKTDSSSNLALYNNVTNHLNQAVLSKFNFMQSKKGMSSL